MTTRRSGKGEAAGSDPETRVITREELLQHATLDSLWVCIHKKVYDVTTFVEDHPGGDTNYHSMISCTL